MKKKLWPLALVISLLALTACNVAPQVPPTAIVIIITPTPLPPTPVIIIITPAPTFAPATNPTTLPPLNPISPTNAPASNPTALVPPTNAPAPTNPPAPTATPIRATSTPQPTTALIPTPASNNFTAVWGPHQNGFFIYLSDRKEIWAFMGSGNAPAVTPSIPINVTATPIPRGKWQKFPDPFIPGTDQDYDSTIIAPPGLLQPKGGFGKVWRSNPTTLRTTLGWATEWERAYIANVIDFYTRSGTSLVAQHTITVPNGWTYFIDEATGTWERR